MNLKKLYISAGILAALALFTTVLKNGNAPILLDDRVGSNIVEPSALRNAARIVVEGEEGTITLQQDASRNRWVLEEKHGLPVSYDQVSRFAQSIEDAKLQRFVSETPERIATLGFENGSSIRLLDASGTETAAFELGKETDSQRQFFRYQGEDKAFLVNTTFNINTNLDSWLDKSLVSFEADDATAIQIELQDGDKLSVSRADADSEWSSEGLPEGKVLNQGAISQIASRLAGLTFTTTADKSDPNVAAARKHSHSFELALKDGKTYRYRIGRQPEIKVEQTVERQGENGETTTATEEVVETPEGPVYFSIEASDAEDPVNGYMDKIAFEASSYQFTSLPSSLEALLADAPQAQAVPAEN